MNATCCRLDAIIAPSESLRVACESCDGAGRVDGVFARPRITQEPEIAESCATWSAECNGGCIAELEAWYGCAFAGCGITCGFGKGKKKDEPDAASAAVLDFVAFFVLGPLALATLAGAACASGGAPYDIIGENLLVVLLALAQLAMFGPGITLLGVDVLSFALVIMYIFGVRLISAAQQQPMWHPRRTRHTAATDTTAPTPAAAGEAGRLWLSFLALALLVAGAGWVIAETGVALAERTGLSKTLVGTVLTSAITSTPELVVAVAAVRRGALTLAVGDILGGNGFDVLFLVLSDVAYRAGSIHQAVSDKQAFWLALNALLVGVLLLGLLRRQRHGMGNIGFEGVLVLGGYVAGVAMIIAG